MAGRIAVVGAGITGISAAYALRGHADVTLLEAEPRAGGHANTVEVEEDGRTLGLDNAFVVYNEPHYPRLTGFLAELDVPTLAHVGGFSFYDNDAGWRYTSEELQSPAGTSPMDRDPATATVKEEAARFHRESPRHFVRGQADLPLGDYLRREGYSEEFKWGFIVLICTAAWSVPARHVWEMSAATIIAFFWGHGEGGLGGRTVEWRTVEGGSIRYVRRALDVLRSDGCRVRLGSPVTAVEDREDHVVVRVAGTEERYDQVVVATHADDALALVHGLAPERRDVLGIVEYGDTTVHVHTDPVVMPRDRAAWRSWNYGRTSTPDGQVRSWVVYYLNALQSLDARQDYFATLDYPGELDPERVIATFAYRHPVLTHEVRQRQDELRAVMLTGPVKFAGSYLHSRTMGRDIIGGHESAFDTGLAAAQAVLAEVDGECPHSESVPSPESA